jgi:uncharacterized iron-regulated membrane protein
MLFKIAWAVLDVATIVVLGSGVYLWVRRRRITRGEQRPAISAGKRMAPAE